MKRSKTRSKRVIYSNDTLSNSESNKSDNSLSDSNHNPRSTNSRIKGRNSPKVSNNSIDISYLGKEKPIVEN